MMAMSKLFLWQRLTVAGNNQTGEKTPFAGNFDHACGQLWTRIRRYGWRL